MATANDFKRVLNWLRFLLFHQKAARRNAKREQARSQWNCVMTRGSNFLPVCTVSSFRSCVQNNFECQALSGKKWLVFRLLPPLPSIFVRVSSCCCWSCSLKITLVSSSSLSFSSQLGNNFRQCWYCRWQQKRCCCCCCNGSRVTVRKAGVVLQGISHGDDDQETRV